MTSDRGGATRQADADEHVGQPGADAENPAQIPARGWWQVVRRAFKESSTDNISILAAGVTFAAFLSLFPALIAALSIYGLVADPATVTRQVESFAGALPDAAQSLLTDQLASLAGGAGGALTFGLVFAILLALWSASSGTASLMTAINIAYDEEESRGFLKLRGTALLLTLGAIVFVLVALVLVAVVPLVLNALPLGAVGTVLAQVARWALLVGVVVVALAVVYKVAPDRDSPRFSWVSPGAIFATVLWVLASAAFSFYVNNFGSYNATYGALAGVVVLLLWLYLTSYLVLLGAEINAESERQTAKDSTRGKAQPMGARGGVAADTMAGQQ
ncbi:MAG TPA: YihY/virulence factor BrkB family protein [Pseudonocardia sp.]|nr:YihY/virulence factor BrkB family protein [Pseudonocardia sp.]